MVCKASGDVVEYFVFTFGEFGKRARMTTGCRCGWGGEQSEDALSDPWSEDGVALSDTGDGAGEFVAFRALRT